VLSLLVLDCSTSMSRFGHAPEQAVNRYLDTVRADTAHHHVTGLVTFSEHFRTEIQPAPVHSIPRYKGYRTDAGTLLWRTVKRVLRGLSDSWDTLSPAERANLSIVVSVLSDGDDNLSDRRDYPSALQDYARRGRKHGWQLASFGIGIDGKRLAREMGFDEELSQTVEPTEAGVYVATDQASYIPTTRPRGNTVST
jgi:hypothetical protein